MISPPRRADVYPGRLPPVRQQWAALSPVVRAVVIGVPTLAIVAIAAVNLAAGVTVAVLFGGAGLATVVFVKNRTDRHNAGVDRGEVRVAPDPHFRKVERADLPPELLGRLDRLGYDRHDVGRVLRYDEGWIVGRRNPRDVAAVVGDDGGWARFDPRTVTDLWAVTEYRSGRGHEPEA